MYCLVGVSNPHPLLLPCCVAGLHSPNHIHPLLLLLPCCVAAAAAPHRMLSTLQELNMELADILVHPTFLGASLMQVGGAVLHVRI
jgi:hypothetical protein